MAQDETVRIPRWILLGIVTFILGTYAFILKSAYADINETKVLALKHDTLIPILQSDISEVKSDIKGMRGDLKEVLRALRT